MEIKNITAECEKCPDCQTAMIEIDFPILDHRVFRCPKCFQVWRIKDD